MECLLLEHAYLTPRCVHLPFPHTLAGLWALLSHLSTTNSPSSLLPWFLLIPLLWEGFLEPAGKQPFINLPVPHT